MVSVRKLPLNDVLRTIDFSGKENKSVEWHSHKITIRPFLPIKEFLNTVRDILKDCRTPDDKVALELLDYSIRSNIIAAYALVELPKDFDELYYIVYNSDLYDLVLENSNKAQIESIINTVNRCIM